MEAGARPLPVSRVVGRASRRFDRVPTTSTRCGRRDTPTSRWTNASRPTADAGPRDISCLVSDLVFTWELRPVGEETDIDVLVEIPEQEKQREETQRRIIEESLSALTRLAAS